MLVVGVSLFGLYLFTVDIHIKEDAFALGMDIATVIIPWVVLAQGAFYRDVKHWSIAVIRDNTITSYYRKKETCKVDLKKTTYYARLKIPKDRLSASNVYCCCSLLLSMNCSNSLSANCSKCCPIMLGQAAGA